VKQFLRCNARNAASSSLHNTRSPCGRVPRVATTPTATHSHTTSARVLRRPRTTPPRLHATRTCDIESRTHYGGCTMGMSLKHRDSHPASPRITAPLFTTTARLPVHEGLRSQDHSNVPIPYLQRTSLKTNTPPAAFTLMYVAVLHTTLPNAPAKQLEHLLSKRIA